MNGVEVKEFRNKYNLTQLELAKITKSSLSAVRSWEQGQRNMPQSIIYILKIFEASQKEYLSKNNTLGNEVDEDNYDIPKGELKPKEYSHTLQVRVVTNKAKAGWADGFYNDEYLENMPIITIDADENHRGKYLAFEVAGDSMEPDYLEGDIVICREVQRHLWTSKLHIKDWDFVIAHYTEGIMLKEIIEHDVEKGIITCHSLNPNHKDFKIKLREVSFLYNVVEVRQKGRSKRWNRAKNFFEIEE